MAKPLMQALRDMILGETVQLNLADTSALPAESTAGLTILDLSGPVKPAVAVAVLPDNPVHKAADLSGAGVTVIELGGFNAYSTLLRKSHVRLFRNYAKHSSWVRAAIDYHRRMLGRAVFEIVPIDSTEKLNRLNKNVRAEVEQFLRHPNTADDSYGTIKEQWIEDYLVVGHGTAELDLSRDLTVRGMRILDAACIGIVKKWDGTDRSTPRFCEFTNDSGNTVKRYLAHEQVFCMINRPMSDTKLGLSHVETLHRAVLALLSGDELLIKQNLQPIPDSLLNLGEGVTKQQVEDFKHQIQQVRDKLAVIGGAKSAQVIRLTGSAEEMKILDSQEWFVRQVAAVFGISTAKLKLSVDTSRANTEAMLDDDLEMITGELTRIEEMETAVFINRHSYKGELNLKFSYPIMQRKDEKVQAQIAKQSAGNNFISINEARSRTGEKPLDGADNQYADEILINTKEGPIPMSVWTKMIEEREKNIGKPPPGMEPPSGEEETPDEAAENSDNK